jgi:uncharacterized protein YkwD
MKLNQSKIYLPLVVVLILTLFLTISSISGKVTIANASSSSSATATTTFNGGTENQVIRIVNQKRSEVGAKKLKKRAVLNEIARIRANQICNSSELSHSNLDGITVFDLLANYGMTFMAAGEDLAMGTASIMSAENTVNLWMNSPAHRNILLNGIYRRVGVGVIDANGNRIVTIVLIN